MSEDAIYRRRFDEQDRRLRKELWAVICSYLQRYVPPSSALLEIGCGDGEFIRNMPARERWAADLREIPDDLPEAIRYVQADGLKLREYVPEGHYDRIFMSNYLEHLLSPDDVIEQLRVVHDLLAPGGQVIILQPDIALIGGAYWDFIDHRVPITRQSLTEALELAGMRPVEVIPRFLPYTTKGRLPTSARLAELYLRLRPAWWLLGKQMLVVAEPWR